MRVAALWVAVAVAGCNQVFDLRDTVGPSPPDSDHDGVADREDNCQLVANPMQEDADEDGLGDACDACPMGAQTGEDGDHDGVDDGCDVCLTGSNHDEDHDGMPDGCDSCPQDPMPQPDSDGDGIGDSCDPHVGHDRRALFDGFGTPAQPGWIEVFSTWKRTADGYTIEDGLTTESRSYRPDAVVTGRAMHIAVSLHIPAAGPTTFSRMGVRPVHAVGGESTAVGCYIEGASPGPWTFNATQVPNDTSLVLSFVYFPDANVSTYVNVGCELQDHGSTSYQMYPIRPDDMISPELDGQGNAIEIEWIDAISDEP